MSNLYKCLVVEDEPLAQNVLKNTLPVTPCWSLLVFVGMPWKHRNGWLGKMLLLYSWILICPGCRESVLLKVFRSLRW
ncbi:hypothetical protein [Paraflavitalea speifideaquila]|uniref:hypothetical protein n=1 Tax=Paraflavitalea speifideaquila TaxID=3076558 RepID=UPI0028F0D4A2|nr:hypothetical protein [Paraflavitalea speifideiaquila]